MASVLKSLKVVSNRLESRHEKIDNSFNNQQESLVSMATMQRRTEVIENLTNTFKIGLIEKTATLLDTIKHERNSALQLLQKATRDDDTTSSKMNAEDSEECNDLLEEEDVYLQAILKLKDEKADLNRRIKDELKELQSLKDAHQKNH